MSRHRTGRAKKPILAACLLGLGLPAVCAAQGGPGFLFREPTVTVKFETGYGMQAATSDVFDFTREQLTVGWRDFDAPYIGGEIAYRAAERWDVALGVGGTQSSVESEFWDWVDGDDLPIEQVTEFRVIPVTVSAKYYFRDRGRSIGRFAWIPNTLAPYVGAGVGLAAYRFAQTGDFVDFETLDIFYDDYVSDGWAPLVRGLAGLSVSLGKQFELSGEARYALSSADMGADFAGYRLGLNGLQAVFGIAVRF
jgi:hypothetical protein